MLADEILKHVPKEVHEDEGIKVRNNRTVINKYSTKKDDFTSNPNRMAQGE